MPSRLSKPCLFQFELAFDLHKGITGGVSPARGITIRQ